MLQFPRVIGTDTGGYRQVEEWSRTGGHPVIFGVEARLLRPWSLELLAEWKVPRDRGVISTDETGDLTATSDSLHTDTARSVLAGTARATTKPADGAVEMIREVKLARDGAAGQDSRVVGPEGALVNAPCDT